MKTFRTLNLAKDFYTSGKHLQLKQPLRDQYDRALLSIPLNLAEGAAKPTAADRRRFFRIALGSLREVQVILDLVEEADLAKRADVLAAHLYKLVQNS